MQAKDFDQAFETGEDLTPYLNLDQAKRLGADCDQITPDRPLLERIDQEASRPGVTPQTVIQTSLTEHLTPGQS